MRKLEHEEIPRADPGEISTLPRHEIAVIAHDIRSIHNVGSMFRTSDAARISHLYLTGYTGTPEHRMLRKTALGAQHTVPWSHHEDPHDVIDSLAEEGYQIAVLEQTTEPTPIDEVSSDAFPVCMILGNELDGVDQSIIDRADYAFEIHQFGTKQSLNVSVAYGIAIFDLVRRYRHVKGLDPHPFHSSHQR